MSEEAVVRIVLQDDPANLAAGAGSGRRANQSDISAGIGRSITVADLKYVVYDIQKTMREGINKQYAWGMSLSRKISEVVDATHNAKLPYTLEDAINAIPKSIPAAFKLAMAPFATSIREGGTVQEHVLASFNSVVRDAISRADEKLAEIVEPIVTDVTGLIRDIAFGITPERTRSVADYLGIGVKKPIDLSKVQVEETSEQIRPEELEIETEDLIKGLYEEEKRRNFELEMAGRHRYEPQNEFPLELGETEEQREFNIAMAHGVSRSVIPQVEATKLEETAGEPQDKQWESLVNLFKPREEQPSQTTAILDSTHLPLPVIIRGPLPLSVSMEATSKLPQISPSTPESTPGFVSGGSVNDHPGKPQGTDTIPAWLSPGEYVVNAKSAAAHKDELEAINAGIGLYKGGSIEDDWMKTWTNLSRKSGIDFKKMVSSVTVINDPNWQKKGRFSINSGRMILNEAYIKDINDLQYTMSHELGHAVDAYVGIRNYGPGQLASKQEGTIYQQYGRHRAYMREVGDKVLGTKVKKGKEKYRYSDEEGFAEMFSAYLTDPATEKEYSSFGRDIVSNVAKATRPKMSHGGWVAHLASGTPPTKPPTSPPVKPPTPTTPVQPPKVEQPSTPNTEQPEQLEDKVSKGSGLIGALMRAHVGGGESAAGNIAAAGAGISAIGDSLMAVNPALGTLGKVAGGAAQGIGMLMGELDKRVERYGQYSGVIAQSQAETDMLGVLRDIERAQKYENELADYNRTSAEIQQRFEDTKIKFLAKISPAIVNILEILNGIMSGDSIIGQGISNLLDNVSSITSLVREWMESDEQRKEREKEEERLMKADPTEWILGRRPGVGPGSDPAGYMHPEGQNFDPRPRPD